MFIVSKAVQIKYGHSKGKQILATTLNLLVFKRDMSKEMRHRFLIVNSSDSLSQQYANINSFDLMTLKLLKVMGNGVRYNDFINWRLLNQPWGIIR